MQKSVEPFHNHNHDDNDDGPTNEDSHSLEYYCQHGVVFFLHSRLSIVLKDENDDEDNDEDNDLMIWTEVTDDVLIVTD